MSAPPLVACEVNNGDDFNGAFYAATPPLETKKMLFGKYADQSVNNEVAHRLSFIHI